MRSFEGIADAADSVRRFFLINQASLPEELVREIEPHTGTGASPVDLIAKFTEGVYARQADVPAEALLIAAGTADLINANGYHGRLDGRAPAIMGALRRQSGEAAPAGRDWPNPAEDPAPLPAYLAPPPEEEEAAEGEEE